jgi:hypothetical protein
VSQPQAVASLIAQAAHGLEHVATVH